MGGALSTDLTAFYNSRETDTSTTRLYLNEPDDLPQGNRRERRARAAQERRKRK